VLGFGQNSGGRPGSRAEGAPGRALQLLTSDGACDSADPAVLDRLRELHPQAEGPGLASPLQEERPNVTPSWAMDQLLAMEAVVRSFPPGSAAGPSGLRPQHLLDCLNSEDSAAKTGQLEALLTLVTTVSTGRLQPRVVPYLCAGRLIPLKKKDRGVRPIAVGDTLRRLTARWLLCLVPGTERYCRPRHPADFLFEGYEWTLILRRVRGSSVKAGTYFKACKAHRRGGRGTRGGGGRHPCTMWVYP